jgi:hypothetical protein
MNLEESKSIIPEGRIIIACNWWIDVAVKGASAIASVINRPWPPGSGIDDRKKAAKGSHVKKEVLNFHLDVILGQ